MIRCFIFSPNNFGYRFQKVDNEFQGESVEKEEEVMNKYKGRRKKKRKKKPIMN